MTTSEQVVATTKKKTKINLGETKKYVIKPVSKSCDSRKNISYVNKGNHGGSEQSTTPIGTKQKLATRKRGSSGTLAPDNQKRRKMGQQHCSHILEKLMTHPAAWVFNQPVDPLMLNIPDYFSVVTHPMDFGTIKSKLVNNSYFGSGEFVADVRLTFSNARRYNPVHSIVHLMAIELDDVFCKLWKPFDVNRSCESSEADIHGQMSIGRATKAMIATKKKTASMPKRTISFEDKQKLRKELCSVLRRNNIPHQLRVTLRRFGLPLKIDEYFVRTFYTLKDECFLELRKIMRNFVDTTEVKSAKPVTNCNGEFVKNFIKEIARKELRQCLGPANSLHSSITTSNGTVSVVDDEIICQSSHLGTSVIAAISGEVVHTPLSPKRALRAALLKRRFADTIMRAPAPQHKPLRGKLEKKTCEEKIRVAAQARTAVNLKTQREKEREAARVALQMVEKTVDLEDNIHIMKELEMLSGFSPSDHESSTAASGSESSCTPFFSPCIGCPLERLGLILKSEYLGDEEDEDMALNGEEVEEGEIIS